MIWEIENGISLALAAAFPDCRVYGGQKVSQGLETPCFFVGPGEWTTGPRPCGLSWARLPVDVVYFPENEGDYGEMWSVGPEALALLGELALPGGERVRGTGLRCAVVDGLMHIQAVYALRLRKLESREMMEKMTIRSEFYG